ncbi:MAG: hypothetical protein CM15mP84_05590 [Cellvibrionales bacterium]|nr:MAG: hypothetical protein CM15mP84_05590 [Cellvibrionales bacterium]
MRPMLLSVVTASQGRSWPHRLCLLKTRDRMMLKLSGDEWQHLPLRYLPRIRKAVHLAAQWMSEERGA